MPQKHDSRHLQSLMSAPCNALLRHLEKAAVPHLQAFAFVKLFDMPCRSSSALHHQDQPLLLHPQHPVMALSKTLQVLMLASVATLAAARASATERERSLQLHRPGCLCHAPWHSQPIQQPPVRRPLSSV